MKSIVEQFDFKGKVASVEPLGSGLINDTYKVTTEGDAPNYVLQRINNAIFTDVDMLQRNIEAVTGHIRSKLLSAGESDIDRKVLRFVPLKNSAKTYFFSGEKYWRLSVFIEDSVTPTDVNVESAYDTGRAIGKFEDMLSDMTEPVGEIIPGFHDMELRSRQLKEAAEKDAAGRMSDPQVRQILSYLQQFDEEMCKAERMFREGVLPKRICHCDTKVNNTLLDREGNVLCVIDLDTVMPSFVFSDVGDFMRTGAATVAEDCPEIDKVGFRKDIYDSFVKGYLETAHFLTPVEKENLPFAARLFPYMQAVRFFADYLNGDTYYKTAYPEHNLVRTKNQIALFDDTTKKLGK